MAINPDKGYSELSEHVGHNIEVVSYGYSPHHKNVAVECTTCGAVLFEFDEPRPDFELIQERCFRFNCRAAPEFVIVQGDHDMMCLCCQEHKQDALIWVSSTWPENTRALRLVWPDVYEIHFTATDGRKD